MLRKSKRGRQLQDFNIVRMDKSKKKKTDGIPPLPLPVTRKVQLNSRLQNSGVNTAIIFLSMIILFTYVCLYFCSHTPGYTVVNRKTREFVQSPGKRILVVNSDRFKQSLLKNKVWGVRQARKDLEWNHIGLPEKNESKKVSTNIHSRSQVAEQQSKHTSKKFVDVEGMSSRYITCLSHLEQFVSNIAASCPCASVSSDGHVCGGRFQLCKTIPKGEGGQLKAQAICDRCGKTISYGCDSVSPAPTKSICKQNIGRDLMFSFILMGRPMYSHYKKIFGSFGMDCYNSRTFQKAVTKVAAALIKRQHFEVSECVLTVAFCLFLHSSKHTYFLHSLPYRLRLPRNTCVSSQEMHLPMHLWEWMGFIRLVDTRQCMVLLSWGAYNFGGRSWGFTACLAITPKTLLSPQVARWKGMAST